MFGKFIIGKGKSGGSSEEIEIKLDPKTITKAELDLIGYGQLKEAFDALGIPEVWKPGSKKSHLVENAVKALSLSNRLEKEGYSSEEIAEKLIQKEADEKAYQAQLKLEEEQREEERLKKAEAHARGIKLSKDKIESALVKIQRKLNSGNLPPAHRKSYLEKVKQYEAILADGYYTEGEDAIDIAKAERNAKVLIEAKRIKDTQRAKAAERREERKQSYADRVRAKDDKLKGLK